LALVFAEPVRRGALWKQALEKWNMMESQQVLEWMAEGQLQASRMSLRDLLEDRFGPLPEALALRIAAATNPERLRAAVRQAPHLGQLDDLQL
jgi:hypothetical protein